MAARIRINACWRDCRNDETLPKCAFWDAVGLAAPGMGSDADAKPYDVLLVGKDGSTKIFVPIEPDRG